MGPDQVAIAFFGLLAAWLNQDTRLPVRRWASVLGLLAQPAWLYAGISAHQWGAVVVCLGYTAAYVRGVRLGWSNADG